MTKQRKNLILIAILAILPAFVMAQENTYGEALSDAKTMKAKTLAKTMDGKETMEVKLEGEILEVCQMKGCWMTVDAGNDTKIRVTFKDYAFFVPKDAAGNKAVFEGEAKYETLDVATLKHYAEDAGKTQAEIDAITEPETKLTFVASGVQILEK